MFGVLIIGIITQKTSLTAHAAEAMLFFAPSVCACHQTNDPPGALSLVPPVGVLFLLGNQCCHPSLGGVADLRIRAALQTFQEMPQGSFNAVVGAGCHPIRFVAAASSFFILKTRYLLYE